MTTEAPLHRSSDASLPRALPDPPAPPALPTRHPLGHLGAFQRDPLELLMRARREQGDVVRVRIGPQNAYFLFAPSDIKRVLVDRQGSYSKQTRGYDALRHLLGNGLVTSEGSFWRRQRRIAQPAFHKRRLAGLAGVMTTAADDLAREWSGVADSGEPVDVAEEMMRATLRIAGETLFSYDLTQQADEVGGAVTDMLHMFNLLFRSAMPFARWIPTPTMLRGRRALKVLDRVVYEIIAQRRQSGDHGMDLLGMLMDARDEDSGETMTDVQLRDEVLTMLTAGHETTANALSWTLYLLSTHPELARRVQRELDDVLGAPPSSQQSSPGQRQPNARDLSALPYLEKVLLESMRLYPPVWALARRVEQDDVLGGYRIPKGGYVVLSPYAVHRHPAYWPNPEAFDPDRFEGGAPRGHGRLAYLPFAAGPRKCIGDHFAKMEAMLILATLLSKYRVALVAGHPIALEPSVTLRPAHGLQMTVTKR